MSYSSCPDAGGAKEAEETEPAADPECRPWPRPTGSTTRGRQAHPGRGNPEVGAPAAGLTKPLPATLD